MFITKGKREKSQYTRLLILKIKVIIWENVNFMTNNKIVICGKKKNNGMNSFRECIVDRNKRLSM